MIPENARLIVTGGAGFIGSHLCAALVSRGAHVWAVDNFDPLYSRALKESNVRRIEDALQEGTGRFHLIEADIRNAAAMRDVFDRAEPLGVFHLAALAGVRQSIAAPRAYASVNIEGLMTVLEAARAGTCRNFMLGTSSSVYGQSTGASFAEDDRADNPISPYAATKRAGEIICQAYARAFGFRIMALRLFTVYGPGQRPDLAIAKFMQRIASGEELPMFGDGSSSRDYTYVDDVVCGMLSACGVLLDRSERAGYESSSNGGFHRIYNLGSDRPVKLRELIRNIQAMTDKPARVKQMPAQAGDVDQTWADLTRSRQELRYSPLTSLECGLRKQWEAREGAVPAIETIALHSAHAAQLNTVH